MKKMFLSFLFLPFLLFGLESSKVGLNLESSGATGSNVISNGAIGTGFSLVFPKGRSTIQSWGEEILENDFDQLSSDGSSIYSEPGARRVIAERTLKKRRDKHMISVASSEASQSHCHQEQIKKSIQKELKKEPFLDHQKLIDLSEDAKSLQIIQDRLMAFLTVDGHIKYSTQLHMFHGLKTVAHIPRNWKTKDPKISCFYAWKVFHEDTAKETLKIASSAPDNYTQIQVLQEDGMWKLVGQWKQEKEAFQVVPYNGGVAILSGDGCLKYGQIGRDKKDKLLEGVKSIARMADGKLAVLNRDEMVNLYGRHFASIITINSNALINQRILDIQSTGNNLVIGGQYSCLVTSGNDKQDLYDAPTLCGGDASKEQLGAIIFPFSDSEDQKYFVLRAGGAYHFFNKDKKQVVTISEASMRGETVLAIDKDLIYTGQGKSINVYIIKDFLNYYIAHQIGQLDSEQYTEDDFKRLKSLLVENYAGEDFKKIQTYTDLCSLLNNNEQITSKKLPACLYGALQEKFKKKSSVV